ncbi:MAG: glycosyltransferase [Candidatus Micrarchaeia archaeon]|jgi:1,2-diacylglycerol 3-alpha-glucosyltransferase
MNIAMFTDSYLPNTDGVVSSILAYKKGLEAKGHRMLVFAPDAAMAKKEPGVHRFAAVPFPPYPEYRAAILPYVSSKIAKTNDISLIHCKAMMTMGLSAVTFAARTKLPAMASLETMIPEGTHYIIKHKSAESIGRKIGWAYLKWFYGRFRLVTSPSKHTQAMLAENKIESIVLPSPIDTDRFVHNSHGAKVKKTLGMAGKKVIASVGRVVQEKNYSFLVKTAAHMPNDSVFMIVGKGPYLDALKQEAWKAGVSGKFVFTGFVPEETLVDYYNAADAFVFPSKFETQGLTHLEAMGCGKPAVVLKDTPMEEVIVEGKNGFSFSEDEKSCAEALLKCVEKKDSMADAARKTALEHSIPSCTEKLLGCYKRLLE